ncbi:SRPX2 [Branchiostoma lanceolatum]|uniref:SRPX2 protein n=1 Tax=Branchiostoma lanceolatum TaxID=7740 RepID=A0A8K0AFX8_BRALA|nr:SRPX2 [Branchiostoma lanceolatum]
MPLKYPQQVQSASPFVDHHLNVGVPFQGNEHHIDPQINAFAAFTNGSVPFSSAFECSTFDVVIGLYPADVSFLQHLSDRVSMTRRTPSFCIFSTDECSRIVGKLRCNGSVSAIYRPIVTDKTPPRFASCPHVPGKTIGRGQTTVHVNIPRPTYTDDRDEPGNCQLNESPTLNGMDLPAGKYEVTFTVSDSSGNTCDGDCTCTVSFEIAGVYCNPISWPSNIARISCTPNVPGNPVWGTRCDYTCLPGYHISGGNTRICEHAGGNTAWVPTSEIYCEEITCGAILAPQHGSISCTDENKYRSVCRLDCQEGYHPEDQNKIAAICQDGGWDDQLTRCIDIQPPIFVSYPTDIVAFTDRNKETTIITWEEPTAIDTIANNIDVPVRVQLSVGSAPGSTFTRGQHLIKYTATDAFLNEATCSFRVIVQVITCPPIRHTLKAELSCPTGYVYGSTCTFGCETGYPVLGPTSFSCERNYSNSEPVGQWDWGASGSQPYCEIVTCPSLRPPDNGALTCDGWAYGTFCLIQCNEKWDVPLDTPERYVCETLLRTWNPDDDVPNCVLPRDPDSMNLPSELYYYSGDCRDPDTQVQIQENFIAILNSSDYSDICQLFVECAAENVQVICGNVTARSLQPSFQLRVNFDLTVKVKAQADHHVSYIDVEDTLFAMADKFNEGVKGGNFSLHNVTAIDLEVQPDSFVTESWTNLVCQPGYLPNYDSYICKGCIKGSYLDTNKGTCEKCETGQFQDEDGQITCKSCPPGTWTVKKGSRAIDLCLVTCQPGWYSDTGMEPCAQCEMGHYQSMSGRKQCQRCPSGQTTRILGAKAMNECFGIDLVLNASSQAQLTRTRSDLQGITVSFWIRPHVNSSEGSIVHLQRESDVLFHVRKPESLEIDITSLPNSTLVLKTGIPLVDSKWHSVIVALSHNGKDCKVFVDGAESWSLRLPNDTNTLFPANTDVVLGNGGEGSFAGDISALSVWNGSLLESKLLQLHHSCSYDDSDAVVTWSDALISTGKGIEQRMPSICDGAAKRDTHLSCEYSLDEYVFLYLLDHNDCAPKPCGEHAIGCEDRVGSYWCTCEMGFTGTHCDVNINDCHNSSCRNGGTCIDGVANYTCVCPDGFNGKLCEKEIVNGGWGEWTNWSPCSATCGNGTHQRRRQCNNPPPKEDGKDCVGHTTESGTCHLQDCPSCLQLKPSFGVIMDCYRNDTDERDYCQIDCGPGLEFSETPLPLYTCGAESQYKWNHQTENNPKAILPACAHGRIPKTFSLEYEMKYPDLYCTSPEESLRIVEAIKDIGSQNVQDVDCVRRKTCNATVEVHHCSTYGKNMSPASLRIVLCGEVSGTFNMEALDADGNITTEGQNAFRTLSETLIDLAFAAEEIKNKSSSNDFAVVIDGQSFAVDANGSEPRLIADCLQGMVVQKMVCVYCAPGTYYQNRMCVRCPKGTFQDFEGQMSCISCPEGFTTAGVGSRNYSDCYDEPMIQTEQAFTMITDGLDFTSSIPSTTSSLLPGNVGETQEIKDGFGDTTTIVIAAVVPIVLVTTAIGLGLFFCKSQRTGDFRSQQPAKYRAHIALYQKIKEMADPSSTEDLHPVNKTDVDGQEDETIDIGIQLDGEEQASCEVTFEVKASSLDDVLTELKHINSNLSSGNGQKWLSVNEEKIRVLITPTLFSLRDIDTVKQEFSAELWFEIFYKDPKLSGIEDREKVNWGDQWDPRIELRNTVRIDKMESKQNLIPVEGEAVPIVHEFRKVTATFKVDMDLSDFPFDKQKLTVQLMSGWSTKRVELRKNYGSNDVITEEDFSDKEQWEVCEYLDCKDGEKINKQFKESYGYPLYNITAHVQRRTPFYMFNIVLILFLITALTFTTFSVRTDYRLSNTFTLLLTTVAIKLVVSQYLPTVSYMTLMDKYVVVCILFQSCVALQNAVASALPEDSVKLCDQISATALVVFVIVAHLVFGIIKWKTVSNNNKEVETVTENAKIRVA